jgi:hypothetical protein
MACIIVSLLALSYIGQITRYILGYPFAYGLIDLFYIDNEGNIPAAYQFLAILSCSIVIAITPHETYKRHWKWLAIIFVFLAFDELAGIHELTMNPMYRLFGRLPGIWAPSWVVLGLAAVAVVGVAYIRFLFHLNRREQVQVVAAASLFVGGAAGVEMATRLFVDDSDPDYQFNMVYATLAHIEEAMEKFGILVFLDFLLRRSGNIFLSTERAGATGATDR